MGGGAISHNRHTGKEKGLLRSHIDFLGRWCLLKRTYAQVFLVGVVFIVGWLVG